MTGARGRRSHKVGRNSLRSLVAAWIHPDALRIAGVVGPELVVEDPQLDVRGAVDLNYVGPMIVDGELAPVAVSLVVQPLARRAVHVDRMDAVVEGGVVDDGAMARTDVDFATDDDAMADLLAVPR